MSSTSRARTTSPTLVMPMHSTAAVERAEQRADLGAAGQLADAGARLGEQRRAALGRAAPAARAPTRMPGDQQRR